MISTRSAVRASCCVRPERSKIARRIGAPEIIDVKGPERAAVDWPEVRPDSPTINPKRERAPVESHHGDLEFQPLGRPIDARGKATVSIEVAMWLAKAGPGHARARELRGISTVAGRCELVQQNDAGADAPDRRGSDQQLPTRHRSTTRYSKRASVRHLAGWSSRPVTSIFRWRRHGCVIPRTARRAGTCEEKERTKGLHVVVYMR